MAGHPGGLPRLPPAGTWTLTGVLMVLVGSFLASGGDEVMDGMLPGANDERMAEQGSSAKRRFLAPRPRWAGAAAMVGGVLYRGLGALV